MTNKEIALRIADILDNKKAADVVVIDIKEKSSFADYFLVAAGNSERQVASLQSEVEDKMGQEDIHPRAVEGKGNSGWILMDYGDVIVNLFTPEQRERYHIEKVWGDCPFLSEEDGVNKS